MSTPPKADLPAIPYPGIEPFTYAERKVFFARAAEARRLNHLIALYRGVLLYAASGMGKSSLVNAGVIPLAIEEGYRPERLRVQDKMNEEILVEPIRCDGTGTSFLPSVLADGGEPAVLSVESFQERLRARAAETPPLLIFDQFEEWVTLFRGQGPCRTRILNALVSLMIDDPRLPVKVLIVLREDYLANLQPLFERCPNLSDNFLRLTGLGGEPLRRTVRGPFETYPEVYKPEIGSDLAAEIVLQLTGRSVDGDVPLTEVQVVCRTLFEAGLRGEDPARAFVDRGGVQGILESYLKAALDSLGPKLRAPAVALLSHMLTSAGTRNVISREDLLERVAREDESSGEPWGEALDLLEQKTHLVRKELRREFYLYEIVSEFLVGWIREEGDRLRRARIKQAERLRRAAERSKRRWRFIAAGFAAGFLGVVGIAGYAKFSAQKAEANRQRQLRISQLLYEESESRIESSVPQALLLAVESIRRARAADLDRFPPAEESLRNALAKSPGSVLGSYGSPVFDTALSPDGQWLAGLGKGGVLFLWRATPEGSVRKPVELQGYQGRLAAIAVSPDASWLAAVGNERSVSLWKLTPRDSHPRLLSPAGPVTTVLFSADGRWLLAAGEDDVPYLWSLQEAPAGEGQSLAGTECPNTTGWSHSRSARWIAVGCDDGTALVWDLNGGEPSLRGLPARSNDLEEISALAFSPDESHLATGSTDGSVCLWTLGSPASTSSCEEPRGQPGEVSALAFHPDGTWLAKSYDDGTVRLQRIRDGVRPRSSLPPVSTWSPRSGLAWSPDGRWLLTRGTEGRSRLFAPSPSGELVPIERGFERIVSAAFSPDGRWLAAGDQAGILYRLDLMQPTASPVSLRAHEESIRSLGFGAGGWLFTRSVRGPARLWELGAENPTFGDEPSVSRAPGEAAFVPAAQRSPDGKWSFAVVEEDLPILRNLEDPAAGPVRLVRHLGGVTTGSFSPDSRWLITSGRDRNARLWDLELVRRTAQADEEPDPSRIITQAVTNALFSPDSRWLITLGGTANLWRLGKQVTNRELLGHAGQVTDGVFNRDSRWLVTADNRGKVRLWDISREPPQAVDLPGAEGLVITRVQFDPAGRRVFAMERDGKRLEWRTDLDELVDLACRTAGRNLTLQEWSLERDDYDGRTCPDFPPAEAR